VVISLIVDTVLSGDVVLSALPEGAVIERKTPSDIANCIGASRERFEKELRRGRYVGRMIVVVEGTLADICAASRALAITRSWDLGCMDLALLSFCFRGVSASRSRLCLQIARRPGP
jgi:hypothetical protein